MRLALSVILLLAAVGILIRAYFSTIRPFNIVLAAIRQTPVFVRRQWVVALFLVIPTVAAPFAGFVAASVGGNLPLRIAVAYAWQFVCLAGMALVAIRIHRGLIQRERTNRIVVGRREVRMVGNVLLAVIVVIVIRAVPTVLSGWMEGLPLRMLSAGAEIGAWAVTVAFCFVGPAASLDDPSPFRTSIVSVAGHVVAAAALVIFLQGINALGAIGVGAVLSLTGINLALLVAGSLALTLIMLFGFIVAEHALVIALTRIRENVYEQDTRDRDHNADWV